MTEKTPSQRLRSALYILWEQQKKDIEFDEFYKQQMERFIRAVKERIK